jgi:hypothetical protein
MEVANNPHRRLILIDSLSFSMRSTEKKHSQIWLGVCSFLLLSHGTILLIEMHLNLIRRACETQKRTHLVAPFMKYFFRCLRKYCLNRGTSESYLMCVQNVQNEHHQCRLEGEGAIY